MGKKIIHIGANKTGSTTLQRCVFSKSKDLIYLGEDCADYDNYRNTLNSLVSDDDIHFCYEESKRLFEKFTVCLGTKTFVYSNEDIMSSRVSSQCAKRLHKFLPDAEILVVIRNQLTAIASWYTNHGAYLKMVPRRYWRRYVSFEDWMEYCCEFIKYSPLDSFFYDKILNLYASLFGKEKIHILFYEDWVNGNKEFIRELCRILSIEDEEASTLINGKRERRRNTMREFRYHQFRSWFLWRWPISRCFPGQWFQKMWHSFLARGAPADGFMSDYWRDRITELYREGNAKLAKDYDLSVKKYGYPS